MRQSITRTVSIKAPATRVFASLSEPGNLPDWVRTVTQPGKSPEETANAVWGRSNPLEVIVAPTRGTVDYVWSECGSMEVAAARVIPMDGEAQVVITLFEPPGACTNCSSLEERSAAAESDLLLLKALLESGARGPRELWH